MQQVVSNAFDRTLRDIRAGESLTELSEKLSELVAAVRATGKGGKLKYELTVKPASKGETVALMIVDNIDVKLPKSERAANIFFANDQNLLQRSDPRQRELELRSVPTPATPLREVEQVQVQAVKSV